jgi:hypothetical protein
VSTTELRRRVSDDHPWRRSVERFRIDQQLAADRKAYERRIRETACGSCRLLADRVDIRIIQLMLGHASIQQTQRYLNVTGEEMRRGPEVSWKNEGRLLSPGVGKLIGLVSFPNCPRSVPGKLELLVAGACNPLNFGVLLDGSVTSAAYTSRNTVIGSTDAARRAGNHAASTIARASSATAPA